MAAIRRLTLLYRRHVLAVIACLSFRRQTSSAQTCGLHDLSSMLFNGSYLCRSRALIDVDGGIAAQAAFVASMRLSPAFESGKRQAQL